MYFVLVKGSDSIGVTPSKLYDSDGVASSSIICSSESSFWTVLRCLSGLRLVPLCRAEDGCVPELCLLL